MRIRSIGGTVGVALLLCTCLLAAMPATLRAQPLADRVPEDAILYIGWCGASAMPPGYQGSHLKALLDESNIPELFTQFVPALTRRIILEEPEAEEPIRAMMTLGKPLWKYPTALYFSGISFEGDEPMPRLALICQAGPDAKQVHETLTALLAEAGEDVPLVAFLSGEIVGIYIGYDDERDVLAGAGAGAAIGGSAAFKDAFAKLQQTDPVLVLYADVERGLEQIDRAVEMSNEPQAQEIWPKVREASGFEGVKRMIFTDGFDGKDWATRGFIDAPAPRQGLLALMDSKPLSDDLFKTIPQSSSFVSAGHFDPGAFLRQAREMAGAVDPEAQAMFDKGLGAAQMFIGKNLQTEILDPLGDQWAMYLAPEVGGNSITGLVIVNKLDDPTKAEQGLVALSLCVNNLIAGQMRGEELTLSFKNTKIGDMRVWYFAVPFVAPAWGIRDGNLYIGLYPQSVGAASRFAVSGGKSFLDNEKYVALKKRLGVEQPRSVKFIDLPQLAGTGYQIILVYMRLGLGMADMWGVEAPEPVLPAFDKVMEHLSPAGSLTWVDDAGWHLRGVAPFPGTGALSGEQGLVGVGVAAMGTGILLPSLSRARETANRVKCASNLRQLGQGMFIYSNENQGNFPDDYATLVKYMIDMGTQPDVFTCPSGHGAAPGKPVNLMNADELVAWAEENSPYVYLGGGKTNNTNAEDILVYERLGNHSGDGINLLFGDGHVEFQTTNGAEQTLVQQGVEPEWQRR